MGIEFRMNEIRVGLKGRKGQEDSPEASWASLSKITAYSFLL